MLSLEQRLVLNISWLRAGDASIYRQMALAYRHNKIKENDVKDLLNAFINYRNVYEDVVEEYEDGMRRDTLSDRYLGSTEDPIRIKEAYENYPKWRP